MSSLRLFLSYRRKDLLAAGIVPRIYERLEDHYGAGKVFMDVDTIPPGADFVDYLGSWVGRADVLLAVIGPQWADLLRAHQDHEDDFVRIEIEAALERKIAVIPLLLAGAAMPGADVLTGNLGALRRRNAFPIDHGRDFKVHIARLIADLDKYYGGGLDFTKDLGMKFVAIPPGVFYMGSPEYEEGRSVEEVLHEVILTRGFEIADAPVTQRQWENLMGYNPSFFLESGPDGILSEEELDRLSWTSAHSSD